MFDEIINIEVQKEDGELIPMLSISEEDDIGKDDVYPDTLPVLALKNTVLFPGVVLPITIGRNKSINAVQHANNSDKWIAVVSQKLLDTEEPSVGDLYKMGTVARILKTLKMPDGSLTAILQGRNRAKMISSQETEKMIEGVFEMIKEETPPQTMEYDATISSIRDTAKQIVELSPQIPSEAVVMINNIKNDGFLLNFIASNINLPVPEKQDILELGDIIRKAEKILHLMDKELQLLQLKNKIDNKVRGDIEKQQRDYFLNQQLKTIQEELGNNPQDEELKELAKRAKSKKWNKEIQEAFEKELNKAKRINPQMAEYSVCLTYLEYMLDLPWGEYTKDNFKLKEVQKVLDKDHFGLKKVKERILEHLAVLKLKGDMKAPIICLVGPPGVGKTSLGKSIAKAMKREFVRMSLGGLHDESEIRGHRKTYIGAMPGRIIKSLKKSKSSNPVFVLDEIDKIGKDFRGDPSSALLEVLDPEQNNAFYDNYMELEYDLSKVLFIATANSLSSIQPALLDRMEIINIEGYSTEEKVEIAKKHLLPKQRKEHGLRAKDVSISNRVMTSLIRAYTRESGVRALDRRIAGVMRSIAKQVAFEEDYSTTVRESDLKTYLGPPRFNTEKYTKVTRPGVAIGLAWTRVGGDILFIEASLSKGKGKLTLTGNLGDVMKESATTALSYIKSNAETIGIDSQVFEQTDIHIHVPEGAIPKDGPSAGITMLSALVSAFSNKPLKAHFAMTGEITLRGKVLPVGGIKEKILAAKRSGINTVMLCSENEKHVNEIDQEYIKGVKFIYVDEMTEVLKNAI